MLSFKDPPESPTESLKQADEVAVVAWERLQRHQEARAVDTKQADEKSFLAEHAPSTPRPRGDSARVEQEVC